VFLAFLSVHSRGKKIEAGTEGCMYAKDKERERKGERWEDKFVYFKMRQFEVQDKSIRPVYRFQFSTLLSFSKSLLSLTAECKTRHLLRILAGANLKQNNYF